MYTAGFVGWAGSSLMGVFALACKVSAVGVVVSIAGRRGSDAPTETLMGCRYMVEDY